MGNNKPELIPGTEHRRRQGVLIHMFVDEWEIFCEHVDSMGISRSDAVRRLVRGFNKAKEV